ncbi:MAG: LysR family transcriptional regulator [Eubacteriales bacterium]|nr:LysR family transcriptional regulator [Eubacteriales bacterium]
MNFNQLNVFLCTAKYEHFTKASNELLISQPSLSRIIKELESELEVPLFTRYKKKITLSEYGKVLLKHTNNIFSELNDIKSEISDMRNDTQKNVSLSLYSASTPFQKLIASFNKKYPNIHLKIIQYGMSEKEEYETDLSLYSTIIPIHKENNIQLLEEEILLALPISMNYKSEKIVDLSDFKNKEFICLQKKKDLREITDYYCALSGFSPNVVLESDSPSTIKQFISLGLGISFVPSITWKDVKDSKIKLLHIQSPKCKRYINLSWKKNSYLSKASLLFKDFVINNFNNYL